jgi:IMP dehydrogenase/GMP reductase
MIREGLTYDDVLLVPQHSTVKSRSKIDISVRFGRGHKYQYQHPIIPANMKTITGKEMAEVVAQSGGLAILHRFMPVEEQLQTVEYLVNHYGSKHVAVSVGVQNSDKTNIRKFIDLGVDIFCIDIAHGDSQHCEEMVAFIADADKHNTIIAGNVATGRGAERLWKAGATAVKVGVGPGSLCTTRIETGNGVPQLTALMDVAQSRQEMLANPYKSFNLLADKPMQIIADGGIKNAGDVVKALCFADMVMVGNLFAGCVETPGQVLSINGQSFKEYVGSSTHKTNHVEGVAAIVSAKGRFQDVLTKLLEGLRSGCSYQGANNLVELRDNPEFIRITNAGLRESHPHDVILK